MQTSGFAELSDFQAPAPQGAPRAPRAASLLGFGAGLFARRIGERVEQGVMLMAAPLTHQAVRNRSDDPRQAAHEVRLHWGMNS